MREQAKHTPGPWVVRDFPATSYTGPRQYVTDATPDVQGQFVGHVIAAPTTCPDWSANARLIAAAPDLLAAARVGLKLGEIAVENGLDGSDKFVRDVLANHVDLVAIRAAIAKATGS